MQLGQDKPDPVTLLAAGLQLPQRLGTDPAIPVALSLNQPLQIRTGH